jgi:hypothetical protein
MKDDDYDYTAEGQQRRKNCRRWALNDDGGRRYGKSDNE